ncbi:Bug family tripartite tricarboxylate transporter substrate binding protein [Aestuariirhabdus sp. LZHN29]|uniref:Bug family tripartite tricarboxylate transporter substrate binding protein n=1 Tax=Aestuariirhabdus sp. LZHN29 TaxID=3417462 RepID=UPI003CF6A6C4
MKKIMTGLVAAFSIAAMTTPVEAAKTYPSRNITNVVVWSAGGGTDTVNRVISAEMAKVLDVDINVTNKPGGVAGSLGMSYVNQRKGDGYTLVGLSESCVTAGVMGGWDQRMNVWHSFIVGGSPDLISVSASSDIKSLDDLVAASKKAPGKITAGAGGAGSIHHLNLLAFMKGTNADVRFIPYPGSAPAQTAAVTGEVTLVITSLAEQQQLIRAGKLRPLAMLTDSSFDLPGVGTIPSAFTSYPSLSEHLPISQAIGLAVRADAPEEVKAKLDDAFAKAMASDTVKEWAAKNFYSLSGKSGKAAAEEFDKLESLFAWTLQDLGSAKVSPAKLGIPKP